MHGLRWPRAHPEFAENLDYVQRPPNRRSVRWKDSLATILATSGSDDDDSEADGAGDDNDETDLDDEQWGNEAAILNATGPAEASIVAARFRLSMGAAPPTAVPFSRTATPAKPALVRRPAEDTTPAAKLAAPLVFSPIVVKRVELVDPPEPAASAPAPAPAAAAASATPKRPGGPRLSLSAPPPGVARPGAAPLSAMPSPRIRPSTPATGRATGAVTPTTANAPPAAASAPAAPLKPVPSPATGSTARSRARLSMVGLKPGVSLVGTATASTLGRPGAGTENARPATPVPSSTAPAAGRNTGTAAQPVGARARSSLAHSALQQRPTPRPAASAGGATPR